MIFQETVMDLLLRERNNECLLPAKHYTWFFSFIYFWVTYEVCINVSIFQMEKLRFQKVKWLNQDHPDSKW